jgi:hypothetical protein
MTSRPHQHEKTGYNLTQKQLWSQNSFLSSDSGSHAPAPKTRSCSENISKPGKSILFPTLSSQAFDVVQTHSWGPPGRDVDHLPPASAEVKNEWNHTFASPNAFMVLTGKINNIGAWFLKQSCPEENVKCSPTVGNENARHGVSFSGITFTSAFVKIGYSFQKFK